MSSSTDQAFAALLDRLQNDPNVLGAFLSGSRGKGFATAYSDYDVVVIVQNGTLDECRVRYPFRYAIGVESIVYDLESFRDHAAFGSPEAWGRYDFAHIEMLFDRTGELPALIEQKGRIPDEHRENVLRDSLDAYVNGVYRSLRCVRNKNELGARLEAAVSVPALLTFLLALEGRHPPFPGYLALELTRYPLAHLPLSSEILLTLIDRVLTADVRAQGTLLQTVDGSAREAGLADVLADWGGDYGWMQRFGAEAGETP